jgi:RHS repeat-associated protein
MNDYYPFGMVMPERSFSYENYRFGFNGKENDNEVKDAIGGWQDYGMRMYDPRICRLPSIDPLHKKFPYLSTYQFASNRPIDGVDKLGLQWSPYYEAYVNSKFNQAKQWVLDANTTARNTINIMEQCNGDANVSSIEKGSIYMSSYLVWHGAGEYTDQNDAAVLFTGHNIGGTEATSGDYAAAGIGIFLPFVSGSVVKNIFRGFSTSVEGYKYGGQVFKNAEQFEKALVKAGSYEDRVGMVQSVLRDVAKTNNWKKAGDLSSKTGYEFYDLGDGTFGSIDKLHGNFEIFKKEGKTLSHKGSINIDGIRNKNRNSLYDLKL